MRIQNLKVKEMSSEEELNIFAVVGNPISYSQSPLVMNAAFEALNMNSHYIRMTVDTVEDAVETIHQLGIAGCNITAPFKRSFLPELSDFDIRSHKIGCVNTVVRKGNELIGYNTDVNGIFSSLNQYLDRTEDLFVLIVGTGGAARSAIYTAKMMKMNVFLCGRNFEKTQQLAAETECTAIKPERIQQAAATSAVIISTVPRDSELISSLSFNRFHVVLDSVYPNEPLRHRVEECGAIYISGENWLIFQACPGFKIFTNEDAPIQEMEKALMKNPKKAHKYFALIGLSMDHIIAVASLIAPEFNDRIINLDGVLIPMMMLQDLPDEDEKTLILCALEQLRDKDLYAFLKKNTFAFWLDEGFNSKNIELYTKSIPVFSKITDTLIPSCQKDANAVAEILRRELALF